MELRGSILVANLYTIANISLRPLTFSLPSRPYIGEYYERI